MTIHSGSRQRLGPTWSLDPRAGDLIPARGCNFSILPNTAAGARLHEFSFRLSFAVDSRYTATFRDEVHRDFLLRPRHRRLLMLPRSILALDLSFLSLPILLRTSFLLP
jgi:hypothetical protein